MELDRIIQDMDGYDRDNMLKPWVDEVRSHGLPAFSPRFSFFTSYSTQHYVVKNVFRKYWNVLKNYVLGPVLLALPTVTYRGVPPLRLQVAPNIVEHPKKNSFFHQMKGFYPCRKHTVCEHI